MSPEKKQAKLKALKKQKEDAKEKEQNKWLDNPRWAKVRELMKRNEKK